MSDGEKRPWTAGPWTHEGPDDFGDYNILHPGNSLAIGGIVQNLGFTPEETAANARLISASPDLYEALEAARDTFIRYAELHAAKGSPEGNAKAEANYREAEKIEAALAKASVHTGGGEG